MYSYAAQTPLILNNINDGKSRVSEYKSPKWDGNSMKGASFIIAILMNFSSLAIFVSASGENNAAGGNQYIMYLIAAVAFIVTAIVMRRKK
jgi:hypothetical protein